MSQYAYGIIDNSIYNPALRMYVDLGEYRYGVTLAGAGKPLVCLHGFSESGYTWDGIVVTWISTHSYRYDRSWRFGYSRG